MKNIDLGTDIPLKNIDLNTNIPLKNIDLNTNIPLKNIDYGQYLLDFMGNFIYYVWMAMFDDESKIEVLKGNLSIYKGAIYENVIADIFHKLGKNLYYFEYNSTLEIDFFIRFNGIVTAVEVKSADNTKSKSLNSIMNNWGVEQGIKLSSKNLGINKDNNILSIPIYMAMFL